MAEGTQNGIAQERQVVTEVPGPASRALDERRGRVVARGVTSTLPAYVVDGEGAILVDADGNRLIDFGSGIAVASVGHAAPRVVAAVQEQAARFAHTCFMVSPYESYVAVCEQLARLTPGDHDKRSALFNSGAEAVENAVKIARHATGRSAVVVFDHAYHGRTNLTMALTAKSMPYKHRMGPFAPEVYRMPMAYPFRWPTGADNCGPEAADAVIRAIDTQIGAANLAAILIEPIQGEGGFIVPGEGFLPKLVEYCRANGIVFIADEVQTGFARTGNWFACEHEGIVPDLICTAKGIAAGLPLSAVTGRTELMDAVHPGGLGGTYGGNPICCAAALASIETIEADGLVERAAHIGDVLLPRLSELADRHDVIGDVRGRGAMVAVELVRPGSKEPDAGAAKAVARACHAEGLVVLTCGTFGNVLRFLPPLVISDALLDEGLTLLDKAFGTLSGKHGQADTKPMATPG